MDMKRNETRLQTDDNHMSIQWNGTDQTTNTRKTHAFDHDLLQWEGYRHCWSVGGILFCGIERYISVNCADENILHDQWENQNKILTMWHSTNGYAWRWRRWPVLVRSNHQESTEMSWMCRFRSSMTTWSRCMRSPWWGRWAIWRRGDSAAWTSRTSLPTKAKHSIECDRLGQKIHCLSIN